MKRNIYEKTKWKKKNPEYKILPQKKNDAMQKNPNVVHINDYKKVLHFLTDELKQNFEVATLVLFPICFDYAWIHSVISIALFRKYKVTLNFTFITIYLPHLLDTNYVLNVASSHSLDTIFLLDK